MKMVMYLSGESSKKFLIVDTISFMPCIYLYDACLTMYWSSYDMLFISNMFQRAQIICKASRQFQWKMNVGLPETDCIIVVTVPETDFIIVVTVFTKERTESSESIALDFFSQWPFDVLIMQQPHAAFWIKVWLKIPSSSFNNLWNRTAFQHQKPSSSGMLYRLKHFKAKACSIEWVNGLEVLIDFVSRQFLERWHLWWFRQWFWHFLPNTNRSNL